MRKLVLENAHPFDTFGWPLALTPDGETLLAAAPFGGNDHHPQIPGGTGVAYVLNGNVCAPDFASMGDLDHDFDIDSLDLGILLDAYERTDAGDVDGDGDTDQHDLGIVLSNYGRDL